MKVKDILNEEARKYVPTDFYYNNEFDESKAGENFYFAVFDVDQGGLGNLAGYYFGDIDEVDGDFDGFVESVSDDYPAEEDGTTKWNIGNVRVVGQIANVKVDADEEGVSVSGEYVIIMDGLLSDAEFNEAWKSADKDAEGWVEAELEAQADAAEYARDPYAYYGVSRSDFY